ncbi:hypothetical protein TRAPUB_8040 [Trametes pubescens]|uniref:Uncharacterized protein n=1 Tax=Trametes pubescens TaxID=154538 RepID=A0A1M2W6A3_TRAPU|nr:hypothetical protein TRAPUB_8040 [Trametes pubescens]
MATRPTTGRSSEEGAREAAPMVALNHVLGRAVDAMLISRAAESATTDGPSTDGAGRAVQLPEDAREGGGEQSTVEEGAHQRVPELGTARMQLGHEGLPAIAEELPVGRFFVELEGRKHSGALVWRKMLLPATLHAAQSMDYRRWNTIFQEVHRVFADVLSEDQLDAFKSIVYAYAWFARTSSRAPEYNPLAIWGELQQLLFTAVNMALHLGSTGEDMLMNVWLWARQRIPDALPAEMQSYSSLSDEDSDGSCNQESPSRNRREADSTSDSDMELPELV